MSDPHPSLSRVVDLSKAMIDSPKGGYTKDYFIDKMNEYKFHRLKRDLRTVSYELSLEMKDMDLDECHELLKANNCADVTLDEDGFVCAHGKPAHAAIDPLGVSLE